jgi:L-fuconolactonase
VRIDAHQHYWNIGSDWHEWPTEDLPAIHRDFGPDDIAPLLAHAAIDATILVQSQPSDRDTDWMLALAAHTPSVAAVVGWVDVTAEAAPARMTVLASHAKFRGVRPMLQGLPPGWILDQAAAPAIRRMAELGLVFDALVRPCHLTDIIELARRFPDLSIVIDHGAKPDIAAGLWQPWADLIAAAADRPNISCKLSGLLTEAAPAATVADIVPYAAHLIDAFAPARLLWGSDWPVVNLDSDYASWLAMAESWFDDKATRAAVFGDNARRIYRLAPRDAR